MQPNLFRAVFIYIGKMLNHFIWLIFSNIITNNIIFASLQIIETNKPFV